MSISKDNSVCSCDGEKGLLNRIGRAGKNKLLIGLYSADLVDAAYHGLLGREPDPEGFAVYKEELASSRNLAGIMKELAHSEEFRQKSIVGQAPEIVRAIYLALLGREPDEEGLASYTAQITDLDKIVSVFADIAHSEEFWQRLIAVHAQDLVKAAFRGLLEREPEPEAAESYSGNLSSMGDLSAILADISKSDEFKGKALPLPFPSSELVRAIYHALLNREPDEKGLAAHCEHLDSVAGFEGVLSDIARSPEFTTRYIDNLPHLNPVETYDKPCLVFIHIQKTAGLSVQKHFSERFPEQESYREDNDRLYKFSASQLARYNFFAGHFNHDSLVYIPRRKLSVFTFVREPKARLLSHYYFFRAHEPGNPRFKGFVELANTLPIEAYFEDDQVRVSGSFWNAMTWAIMGRRQWREWRLLLQSESDAIRAAEAIQNEMRPKIIERLKEFLFIGIQDDFEKSIEILFRKLKLPPPTETKDDNKLEKLLEARPGFKRSMEKQPMTPKLDALLDGYVQLDNIVYEESKKLYQLCLAEYKL